MNRREKEVRLKQLKVMIDELETSVKVGQRNLANAREEMNQITLSLIDVNDSIKVSDHAILRYLERKYNLDIKGIRKEILTPAIIQAIKAGAKAVKVDGMDFKIKNNIITTSI